MNNRIQRLIEPSMRMYLMIMVAFAGATFFFHRELAITEGIVIALLVVYSITASRKNRRELVEYIESVTYEIESAKNDTLLNFPLPMVVFGLNDNQIIWGNQVFFDICGQEHPSLQARLTDLAPGFSGRWLIEGKTQSPELYQLGGHKYQIHGNIVRGTDKSEHDYMGITYWLDVTEFDDIKLEYQDSRPIVALIVMDNYEELLKNITERVRNDLRAGIEERIHTWCDGIGAALLRFERDKFIFIFENRYMTPIIEEKFSLLNTVREVVNPSGIQATVSIGIGKDGASFEENFSFAKLSIEMALSRGGDQAVIKNRFNFEFYGGRGAEIETRTKVKSRVMANALSVLIVDASQIFVMGHKYADLDTLGAAAGISCIARKLGKSAKIVMNPEKNDCEQLLARLRLVPEYEDAFISPQEAILSADNKSLLVIVDTNRPEQVEDESLLVSCNRVAVIDHHRRAATYINNAAFSFLEQYASSVCELMTELLAELVEQSDILRCEAEAMLSGIVMDTKNFTLRTGERTFEAAAFLRRAGADTAEVKKLLQTDLDSAIQKYRLLQTAEIYRDSIAISVADTPQDRVIAAQAADELLGIIGVEASLVAYPAGSGVYISARSIGAVNVQVLLENLGGGGNKSAAAAQIKDKSIEDAVPLIYQEIDSYLS